MTTIEKRCTPRKIEIERKPYYRSTNANKNALIQQFHSAHFVFSVAGIERRRKKQHKKKQHRYDNNHYVDDRATTTMSKRRRITSRSTHTKKTHTTDTRPEIHNI